MRRSIKRARHLPTVALLSLSRAAIELLASPSALLKMMRARSLNERGSERLRAYDVSRPRTLVCGASRHVKGSLRRALPALDLAASHIRSRSSRGIGCHVRTFAVHLIRETTMVKQDTPDTTRDARLEARVSAAQKNLLQQAAALSGRTLSEFVVASAQDAARRVLAEHESIRLSREEQLAFVQALLNPPEPNARLKRAAKAYRQRVGS